MKDDVPPLPARVPSKRRQLERLLDVHVAMWLAGDQISDAERRRLQELKAQRRATVPDRPVGLLVGREGATPPQVQAIVDILAQLHPTEIHHPGVSPALHRACRATGAPVIVHRDVRVDESGMPTVIRQSSTVIAAPKERSPQSAKSVVWDMIRYAKHRRIAVRVVLPDGSNG